MDEKAIEGVADKLTTISVPYEALVIDKEFNSRKDYREIDHLMGDIEERGLISPPIVSRDPKNPDRYIVVAGYRRTIAVGRLREEAAKEGRPMPFERIEVKLFEGPEINRWFMNLAENMSRVDLHVWEIGDQCVKIRDRFQLSGPQIGEKLRYQKSHVNNCIRVVERIAPDIQKIFREGRAEPPFSFLLTLAALNGVDGKPDHDRQRAKWQEWVSGGRKKGSEGSDGDGDGDGDGEGEGETPTGKMRRIREAERVLAKLEEGLKEATQRDREYYRGGIGVAKYMMGLTQKIKKISLAKDS